MHYMHFNCERYANDPLAVIRLGRQTTELPIINKIWIMITELAILLLIWQLQMYFSWYIPTLLTIIWITCKTDCKKIAPWKRTGSASADILIFSWRELDDIKGTFVHSYALLWDLVSAYTQCNSKIYLEILCILPAIQPCDCWTWWNQREGRYNISPAFTVHFKDFAWAYSGYLSRSGFKGSRGIQGTWKQKSMYMVLTMASIPSKLPGKQLTTKLTSYKIRVLPSKTLHMLHSFPHSTENRSRMQKLAFFSEAFLIREKLLNVSHQISLSWHTFKTSFEILEIPFFF